LLGSLLELDEAGAAEDDEVAPVEDEEAAVDVLMWITVELLEAVVPIALTTFFPDKPCEVTATLGKISGA